MRKTILLLGATIIAVIGVQTVRAQSCFFSADFEDGLIPAGWTNTQVTVVANGDPVDAWTVGTAAQANANGSFPVPDVPIGTSFVMANDDALPCDCDMDSIALTTGTIDLTGRTNVWLDARVFNHDLAGGGMLIISASSDGNNWDPVFVAPPLSDWVEISADLSTYDGEPGLQLRFAWSDSGTWAGGVAIDDLCLRERLPDDISVLDVTTGWDDQSPFQVGDQTMRYRDLPLLQAGTVKPAVRLKNTGVNDLMGVSFVVTISLNGTVEYTSSPAAVGDMAAGSAPVVISIGTDWTPPALGDLEIIVTATAAQDDDPSDNSAAATMRITGPGWENGYGAMACDEGMMQGTVGGSNNFIAANRMEIINEGSTARGVSAVIAGNSQLGEKVRAILMDANFSFIDTSLSHVLTEADLNSGWVGEALYLPFNAAPALEPGDYHVGLQRLSGTGDVFVATSGNGPIGAAVLMQGPTFDITYLTGTPMVRLHLEDYGVGLAEIGPATESIDLFPVPANEIVSMSFDLDAPGPVVIEVFDALGRSVLSMDRGSLPAGGHTEQFQVSSLAPGGYGVHLKTPAGRAVGRLVIAR